MLTFLSILMEKRPTHLRSLLIAEIIWLSQTYVSFEKEPDFREALWKRKLQLFCLVRATILLIVARTHTQKYTRSLSLSHTHTHTHTHSHTHTHILTHRLQWD